jgi:hypothetical protein
LISIGSPPFVLSRRVASSPLAGRSFALLRRLVVLMAESIKGRTAGDEKERSSERFA